jgi:hypothetical protein
MASRVLSFIRHGAAKVSEGHPDDLIPDPKVAKRYDVTTRTLPRWDDTVGLDFPRPIVINGRRYRRRSELEQWERSRAVARASPNRGKQPSAT